MGPKPPRERRNFDLGRRGNPHRPLAPCAPAHQQPGSSVVGVCTPCGAVSTRGVPVFVARVLELLVDIWDDSGSANKALASPGAAGPRRWPQGELSPRACSMSLSQLATSHLSWGLHTLRGGIDLRDHRLGSRFAGNIDRRMYYPEMGPKPPRERRNFDLSRWGNPHRPLAP